MKVSFLDFKRECQLRKKVVLEGGDHDSSAFLSAGTESSGRCSCAAQVKTNIFPAGQTNFRL